MKSIDNTNIDETSREIAAKDVLKNWGEVREKAHDGPVIITTHGRRAHVLLTYKDYEKLREQSLRVRLMSELPKGKASSIAAGLRARARQPVKDGDTIIE